MTRSGRRFGDYQITLLVDGVFEAPADVLIHAGDADARKRAIEAWGRPVRVDVNCFALRGPNGVTLVDSGVGRAWGDGFGHAGGGLRAAGVEPWQVDRVLLTHLHSDHALGLLDNDAAVFPNAGILVPRADLDFFSDDAERDAATPDRRTAFDITARLHQAYAGRLHALDDGPVLPGIEAVPLHGHSPGHTGYLLQDTGASLLLWGDTLHIADLQAGDPEIGLVFDMDPQQAVLTRRAALERASAAGWIVAGGHIGGFNRVLRDGSGFRLTPA